MVDTNRHPATSLTDSKRFDNYCCSFFAWKSYPFPDKYYNSKHILRVLILRFVNLFLPSLHTHVHTHSIHTHTNTHTPQQHAKRFAKAECHWEAEQASWAPLGQLRHYGAHAEQRCTCRRTEHSALLNLRPPKWRPFRVSTAKREGVRQFSHQAAQRPASGSPWKLRVTQTRKLETDK